MNINHFIEIVSQLSIITSTDRIRRLCIELEDIDYTGRYLRK